MKFNISIFNETLTHTETVSILVAKVRATSLTLAQNEVVKNIATDFHFGKINNFSDVVESAYFVLENQEEMFLDCQVNEADVNYVIDLFSAEMKNFNGQNVQQSMLAGLA